MSNIDEQFVEFIVKSLVGNPDAVKLERRIDEKGVLIELSVDPEDLGRVIGKRGATAQSIRTLLRALGTKNEARYNLKIVDTGDGSQSPRLRQNQDEPHDDVAAAPADDQATVAAPVDEPVDEPVAAAPVEEAAPVVEETKAADEDLFASAPSDEGGSLTDRTRRELDDLDDLDI